MYEFQEEPLICNRTCTCGFVNCARDDVLMSMQRNPKSTGVTPTNNNNNNKECWYFLHMHHVNGNARIPRETHNM